MWQMAAANGLLFRAPVGVRSGSAACRVTWVSVGVLRANFVVWDRVDAVANCGGSCGWFDVAVGGVVRFCELSGVRECTNFGCKLG